jgi:hypothetical protein
MSACRLACIALALCTGAAVAQKPSAKKSDSVVKATAVADKAGADGTQLVTVTLKIERPWHIYANPVGNEDLVNAQTVLKFSGPDRPRVQKTEFPKSKLIKDAVVGDYKILEGDVVIKTTVQRTAGARGPLEVEVKLQACSDKSCLPPATIKVAVRDS